MKSATIVFISLSIAVLISSPIYGQFEFQERDTTAVSHPAISYPPPQMLKIPSPSSRGGFGGMLAARFQFLLDSMLFAHNLMGTSAAVILPEKGTWLGAGGFSDPVSGDTLRTDMLLEIDSNTKSFVSAIILQMMDEGLLTLEDKMYQWLPSFTNVDSTMTIRQILQHIGGVSDFLNDNPATIVDILNNPSFFWTPEYSLTWVLPPNFPPGGGWSYSNTGYILAGMIIREITGSDSFAVPLRQRLLGPLGLQNTYMDIEESPNGELAHGWVDLDGDGILDDLSAIPRTSWASAIWTAGAIVATAEDLAKWVELLHGDQVLSAAAMQQMRTTVPIPNSNITYGLGIYTFPLFGKTLWGHDGGGIGYNSQALYYREKGVSLAVILNQRGGTAWAGDILAVLFDEVLKYYERPYDHPYALTADANPRYLRPQIDSTVVVADIHNPDSHQVRVSAAYASSDSSTIDSLEMFDDGLHGDGLAGDNSYGGFLGPLGDENYYDIEVRTMDLDTAFTHLRHTACTTIGPVTLEAYEVSQLIPNILYSLKVHLKNNGSTAAATNVTVEVETADTNITNITHLSQSFGNIAPGQIKSSSVASFTTQNNPNNIDFIIHILSKDMEFWSDSLNVIITGIAENETAIIREYDLKQNYPNPFNSTTIIRYQLPQSSDASLIIYNMLGQKVRTLLDAAAPAGNHEIEWNGKDDNGKEVSSGIYMYRLTSKDFAQGRKMLLIR